MALVQQGTTVGYVPAKYIFGAGTSNGASPAAARTFLEGIAEGLQAADASAVSRSPPARAELFGHSTLPSRGLMDLAWTRIRQPSEIVESPDSTLRLSAGGIYYSAFVVSAPIRFKDRPLPSLNSPVLLLDGGGLSVAVVNHACYALGTNGKWSAAGVSAGQSRPLCDSRPCALTFD